MGVLPHALASGFMAHVILTEDCYSAMWYPDVPMDWVTLNEEISYILTVVSAYAPNRKRMSRAGWRRHLRSRYMVNYEQGSNSEPY